MGNTEQGDGAGAAGGVIPGKLDNVEQSPSLKEKAKQAIKKAILSRELQAGPQSPQECRDEFEKRIDGDRRLRRHAAGYAGEEMSLWRVIGLR